jgi:hypothetical protein
MTNSVNKQKGLMFFIIVMFIFSGCIANVPPCYKQFGIKLIIFRFKSSKYKIVFH